MNPTTQADDRPTERRRNERRWSWVMAIALFALFMFGGSFGRAECSGSAGCGEVSERMVTCIAGNAMPCVCACIVVDTMIETGLRVAVAIEPLVAQMPLGSGTLTEPELPPPRI